MRSQSGAFKQSLFGVFFFLASLVTALFWAAEGVTPVGVKSSEIFQYGNATNHSANPQHIRVMTWNIAYAYGLKSEGKYFKPRPRSEFEDRLERIAGVIRSHQPDIVLLQEVDFGSRRSHYMNQLQILAEKTQLPYAAPAVSWRAKYIPFPYWPPKRHLGRMMSGGAILSRFPLRKGRIYHHAKPKGNPWYYNLFYIGRFSQQAEVSVQGRPFRIINNHLEAWDIANRREQAQNLIDWVEEPGPDVLVVGGDMNAVPSSARSLADFSDHTGDDYRGDTTIDLLNDMKEVREIVPQEQYLENEEKFFTFPANDPNRRLDYLYVDRNRRIVERKFIRTGELSDHIPVMAVIQL